MLPAPHGQPDLNTAEPGAAPSGLPLPDAAAFWKARRRLYDLGPAESLPWAAARHVGTSPARALAISLPMLLLLAPTVFSMLTSQVFGQSPLRTRTTMPLNAILALSCLGVSGVLAFGPPGLVYRRRGLVRARLPLWSCAACGYDRAGVPAEAPCPECSGRILVGDVTDARVFGVLAAEPLFAQARSGAELRTWIADAGAASRARQWKAAVPLLITLPAAILLLVVMQVPASILGLGALMIATLVWGSLLDAAAARRVRATLRDWAQAGVADAAVSPSLAAPTPPSAPAPSPPHRPASPDTAPG